MFLKAVHIVFILSVLIAGSSNQFAQSYEAAESQTTAVEVEDPDTAGLAPYPDYPITEIPIEAQLPKYVIEHRSALHGKMIRIKGVVVEAVLGEEACPKCHASDSLLPCPGGCAQPRIFVADTLKPSRDINYDLMILLDEDDESHFTVGEFVEVKGTVYASKVAVYMQKINERRVR